MAGDNEVVRAGLKSGSDVLPDPLRVSELSVYPVQFLLVESVLQPAQAQSAQLVLQPCQLVYGPEHEAVRPGVELLEREPDSSGKEPLDQVVYLGGAVGGFEVRADERVVLVAMLDKDPISYGKAGAHIEPENILEKGHVRIVIAPDVGDPVSLSQGRQCAKETPMGLEDSAEKPRLMKVNGIANDHKVSTSTGDVLDKLDEGIVFGCECIRRTAVTEMQIGDKEQLLARFDRLVDARCHTLSLLECLLEVTCGLETTYRRC